MRHGHDCQAFYMKIDCATTCGYCGTDMLEKINNSVILLALLNNVYLFTEERLGRYHYKDAEIQCSSMINEMPRYD